MACAKPLKRYQLQDSTWTGIRPRQDSAIMAEMDVGCGKCVLCRKQRAIELSTRFAHEALMHEQSCFFTATYSNEHLPELGSLRREHMTKFVQDLRNLARREWNQLVRMDIIGEYSPEKKRPHWHGLLFGVWPLDAKEWSHAPQDSWNYRSELLSAIWPHGHILFQKVSAGSIRYCASHQAFKRVGRELDAFLEVRNDAGELLGYREPEPHICSKHPGIGAGFFAKFGSQAIKLQFTTAAHAKGKYHKTAVPKYYRKLAARDPSLAADLERLNAAAAAKVQGKAEDNTPERLAVRAEVETARQHAQHSRKGVHK